MSTIAGGGWSGWSGWSGGPQLNIRVFVQSQRSQAGAPAGDS